ncbi:N-acetyltransferase family protein [Coleofasciculus chthonoplastes]|uniref:N-acetyltransferase family protein n=1 Tax=Coleofasciculus chthonoplastes TaxID=64178 RepID=UPI0033026FC6
MSHKVASEAQQTLAVDASRLTIRRAKDQDLIALSEILADSFHSQQGLWRLVYPIWRLGIYEDLRNRLRGNSPHYACFVALNPDASGDSADGLLVGTVEIALRSPPSWQPQGHQYPYISNLAVRRCCRRRGVAGQLLLACERQSLAWGFPNLYLHVLDSNDQARQLYLKMGYQLYHLEPSYSLWRRHPQRLLLRKRLNTGTHG